MTQELRSVEVPEFTTVRDLAAILDVSPIDVIKELMNNGIMATINQQIDFDTSAIVAEEMGFEAHLPVIQQEVEEEEEALPLMARLYWMSQRTTTISPRTATTGSKSMCGMVLAGSMS